jgi:hypothetical protein
MIISGEIVIEKNSIIAPRRPSHEDMPKVVRRLAADFMEFAEITTVGWKEKAHGL